MRYFKLVWYAGDDDYGTMEKLIDEPTFRKYQQAVLQGSDFLMLEDRIIKTKLIKEALPADEEVKEYIAMGVSMKSLNLPEITSLSSGQENIDIKKRYNDMISESGFGKLIPPHN